MQEYKIAQEFQQALDAANAEKVKLEKLRKQAFNSIQEAAKASKSELDGSCIQLLQKQKTIDDQIKKINTNQQLLQKQVQNWTELIQKFNTSLKQLGDAGRTASVIVEDLKEIQSKIAK
ncbi:GCN5-like_protein 1 (GCN5L1) family member [Hexamita inflata]|uniref:GCN5-like protein 1 (GCN5L1) family member n=1 Tax=Hexamita inflata TaxID=28002 RepID=A0AA86NXI7_9EUKA|nr:GCN5-like protein 1 (GCN5L1) family member [Hexamita inflata]CAI9927848.1 GCN5-like protein 1 (GCN5L1) family member [Hexamita inflata]CAI9972114.1 GCN5-like protein 1 (GCN5L1) family member [Hexamita inflata]